jgi:hypothetical protein
VELSVEEATLQQNPRKSQSSFVNGSVGVLAAAEAFFRPCVRESKHFLLLPAASAWHWAGTLQADLSHLQMQRHAFHLQLAAPQLCMISSITSLYGEMAVL